MMLKKIIVDVRDIADRPQALTIDAPSRTKQSEREACNINSIVAKYNRTGEQPQNMRTVTPNYGDVSSVLSLHAALNLVNDSMRAFAELPSHIRDHCNNDPGQLLELASDPERLDEAIALGIVDAPEPAEITAAEITTTVEPGVEAPATGGETTTETE